MGKVKDGSPAAKATKPTKGGPTGDSKSRFAPFLANLTHTSLYKPLQGKQARLWTAVALGLIIVFGLREVFLSLEASSSKLTAYGTTVAVGAVMAWLTFRLLQFPPFVEFLIATEAEMNKVSWTNKQDLFRATSVVLATVVLMAVYLFVVDTLWTFMLRVLGVLQFSGGGGLGSTA
jgi:preprotein translocase subunit SecE